MYRLTVLYGHPPTRRLRRLLPRGSTCRSPSQMRWPDPLDADLDQARTGRTPADPPHRRPVRRDKAAHGRHPRLARGYRRGATTSPNFVTGGVTFLYGIEEEVDLS